MKPWQIGLFIAAVVVLGASLAWSLLGAQKIDKPDRIYLVDVTTGELYYAPYRRRGTVLVPARHPETKERTLYPVEEDESSGGWVLSSRYAGGLSSEDAPAIESSGVVKNPSGEPTKYVAPPFDD
ncbi:MAG: hypothetical protein ACIARR_10515 [Phycisphaerales bacterium JB059]